MYAGSVNRFEFVKNIAKNVAQQSFAKLNIFPFLRKNLTQFKTNCEKLKNRQTAITQD
jgi:hypothetical protein